MTDQIREIFYKDNKRTIYWDDIGSRFQIRGILIGDGTTELALSLPFEYHADESISLSLNIDEWLNFLKYSDDPQLVITDEERKIVKAIIRKSSRQIEEIIRFRVYKRDNYQCQYCGATDKPLTLDHYLPQELGGATVMENLKTSCRPCNKAKANKSIYEWEEYRKKRGLKGPHD
jgi:hypothetical protein